MEREGKGVNNRLLCHGRGRSPLTLMFNKDRYIRKLQGRRPFQMMLVGEVNVMVIRQDCKF